MSVRLQSTKGTRSKIMEAALKIFSASGYHRATLEDITSKAGVSKGAVYWYFKSKDELFRAVHDMVMERYVDVTLSPINGIFGAKKKLEFFLSRTLKFFKENTIVLNFYSVSLLRGRLIESREFKKKVVQYYNRLRRQIASILSAGVEEGSLECSDPKAMAAIIIGLIDGLLLQWILDKKEINFEDTSTQLIHTILRSLAL